MWHLCFCISFCKLCINNYRACTKPYSHQRNACPDELPWSLLLPLISVKIISHHTHNTRMFPNSTMIVWSPQIQRTIRCTCCLLHFTTETSAQIDPVVLTRYLFFTFRMGLGELLAIRAIIICQCRCRYRKLLILSVDMILGLFFSLGSLSLVRDLLMLLLMLFNLEIEDIRPICGICCHFSSFWCKQIFN